MGISVFFPPLGLEKSLWWINFYSCADFETFHNRLNIPLKHPPTLFLCGRLKTLPCLLPFLLHLLMSAKVSRNMSSQSKNLFLILNKWSIASSFWLQFFLKPFNLAWQLRERVTSSTLWMITVWKPVISLAPSIGSLTHFTVWSQQGRWIPTRPGKVVWVSIDKTLAPLSLWKAVERPLLSHTLAIFHPAISYLSF